MSAFRQIFSRLGALIRRNRLEQDMAEEMRLHLELLQERNLAAGMTEREARFAAQRAFGGTEQIKERAREQTRWLWLEQGARDVRYALRSVRQAPGFFAIALLTLALGIGVNAVMFSLVRDRYLKPLLRDERLNLVGLYSATEGPKTSYRFFSFTEFETIRGEKQVFSDVAALGYASLALGNETDTKRSLISFVSENYFSLFGIKPAAGRFFTAEECQPNANVLVAVASDTFWRRLGRPRNFVGSMLRLNGLDYVVVGVAPEGFGGLHHAITPEIWVPAGAVAQLAGFMGTADSRDLRHPRSYRFSLIGTLAPGVTVATASSRAAALAHRLNDTAPPGERRQLAITRPSHYNFGSPVPDEPEFAASSQRSAIIALAIAATVLLVASLNVANLLLARGANRRKEFAVRLSVGASRGRVVRQLIAEGLVLGLAAAAVGIGLCAWSGVLIRDWMIEMFSSGQFAFNPQPPIDASVVAFTVVVTVLATLAFSLVPALRATRVNLVEDLKRYSGSIGGAGTSGHFLSLGNTLAMVQIALALALLFGAGLFVRAAQAYAQLDHGFRFESRLVANIDFDFGRTPPAQVSQHQRTILERVQSMSGVRNAAIASAVPYNFDRSGRGVFAVGAEAGETAGGQSAVYTVVSSNYFQTMGVTLLRGRDFSLAESAGPTGHPVAIIDQTLAHRLFGEAEPIGRSIAMNRADASGQNPAGVIEVIGLVRSPREDVFEENAPPRIYRPLGQAGATNTYLVVELAPGAPQAAMVERLRHELRSVEPDNSLLLVRPLRDFPRRNINSATIDFGAILVMACAAVAFVLAVVGIYSVKAYAVARRTREFGIRLALGAQRTDVYRLVLAQGAAQAAIGIGAGAVLAVLSGRFVAHMLYRVSPNDWTLLALVSIALAAATLLACVLPARRATKVDPLVALRSE